LSLVAIGTAGGASAKKTVAYPRAETLYTGGSQWGNIVGFNPYVGNYAAGTVGLVNETLFRYDPTGQQYIFNLSTKGLSAGTWRLKVSLDDGATYTTLISLK